MYGASRVSAQTCGPSDSFGLLTWFEFLGWIYVLIQGAAWLL